MRTWTLRVAATLAAGALLATGLVVGPGAVRVADAMGPNSIVYPDTVGQDSSLVLDSAGRPVVAYYDQTNGDLKLLFCGHTTCSSGNIIVSPDTVGDVGAQPSLVLDGGGRPVVSYRDAGNDDLKLLVCGDPTCSAGNTISSPDTVGEVGWYSSLALDGAGHPVVSYHDFTNFDLKVLVCGDVTCSAGNTITSPDTVGSVGLYSSLALDVAGRPVVSYNDNTAAVFKLLFCGDATCSSGNSIVSPDTPGVVGWDSSMVLDAAGRPVVAYYDLPIRALKVLVCGDTTCSSGNTITTHGTDGASDNRVPSLALDGAGRPVVVFGDRGMDVMFCGDTTCSSGNTTLNLALSGAGSFRASVALDSLERPVVAYSAGDGVLAVLVCGFADCGPCPASAEVHTEAELVLAVECYNDAVAGSTTLISFDGDVVLTGDLPDIDNSTTASLIILGDGHTLDGAGLASEVLHQVDGDLQVFDLMVTGGTDDGIEISGGDAELSRVTSTGNLNGLYADSPGLVSISNSTLAANSAGGLVVAFGDLAVAHQITIVDNGGNGVTEEGNGGLFIEGSLIARNVGDDCAGLVSFDFGGNVFGDTSCNGTATAGLDASLAPGLAANGCGPCTDTVALLAKSPAINAVGYCDSSVDQRFVTRPLEECDAGAFEFEIPAEFCNAKPVTLNLNYLPDPVKGTGGDDVMLGTPADDSINGIGGDDTICGGAGDDTIRGGAGLDTLFGDPGNDNLSGGGGEDVIDGGVGNDTIRGQGGKDILEGGDGDDTIDGLGAADTIDGGGGADILRGQNGADTINGGDGDDDVTGQTGPDYLYGNADDDDLGGGNGNDTLFGGSGTDRCSGNTGPADSAETATCETTPGVEVFF